ncbi:MAG TPA: HIT domain-containing protein [Candidatus Saccharimonadales bacterium]|nr:HIT domain-containing protein [Candidatus Saccharimonadales bacterium]
MPIWWRRPEIWNPSLSETERYFATLSYMDHIFTPWRYSYITTADRAPSCIFCDRAPAPDVNCENDERNLVVHRGEHCFVIVNAFPYTSGHVMIVPYAHIDQLDKLPAEAAGQMMALAQRVETALRELYHPDGVNLGMNIGKAAGAGVAGHIHMHVLPRWVADANFMSVIGETRVLPEALEVTARRLREALHS